MGHSKRPTSRQSTQRKSPGDEAEAASRMEANQTGDMEIVRMEARQQQIKHSHDWQERLSWAPIVATAISMIVGAMVGSVITSAIYLWLFAAAQQAARVA